MYRENNRQTSFYGGFFLFRHTNATIDQNSIVTRKYTCFKFIKDEETATKDIGNDLYSNIFVLCLSIDQSYDILRDIRLFI